jgi:hypothetical protein
LRQASQIGKEVGDRGERATGGGAGKLAAADGLGEADGLEAEPAELGVGLAQAGTPVEHVEEQDLEVTEGGEMLAVAVGAGDGGGRAQQRIKQTPQMTAKTGVRGYHGGGAPLSSGGFQHPRV